MRTYYLCLIGNGDGKGYNWCSSVTSCRKKQEQPAPAKSSSQAARRSSHRVKRALRATIKEYILDHRSQNHSPKTIEWHTLALGNFADSLLISQPFVLMVEFLDRMP